jgi:hypothetical protein
MFSTFVCKYSLYFTHVLFCSLLVTLMKKYEMFLVLSFLVKPTRMKRMVKTCVEKDFVICSCLRVRELDTFHCLMEFFEVCNRDESIFKPYIKTKRTVQVRIKF